MEICILNKPTEYYEYILFNTTDKEITLYCFQNAMDFVGRTRHLGMLLQYKGYIFKNLELKKEMKTKNGEIINNVLVFSYEMNEDIDIILKKQNQILDKDQEIKLIKQTNYKEPGRMIFLTKYILYELTKVSIPSKENHKEDYNDIIERMIESANNNK